MFRCSIKYQKLRISFIWKSRRSSQRNSQIQIQ